MKIIRNLVIITAILYSAIPVMADITSVTASLLDSPTSLSDGRAYFLAGVPYRIRVQAVALDNTVAADWDSIVIQFREIAVPQLVITYEIDTGSFLATPFEVSVADNNSPANYSNIDYTITFTPHWDLSAAQEFDWNAANTINVIVTEVAGSPATLNDTITLPYGMCSSIQVLNFQADGDAADNRINPYHNAFNVTGSIAYFVDGRNITNTVYSIDTTEIVSASLLLDTPAITVGSDIDMSDGMSINVSGGTVTTRGDRYWRARVTMNTPLLTITEDTVNLAANRLNFNCDEVRVTGISFVNGGGVGPSGAPPRYYRSVNFPGTQIVIQAEMFDGGTSVIGNTTFTIQNVTDATTLTSTVQINDGDPSGSAVVDPIPTITLNATELKVYRVLSISSDAYGVQNLLPVNQITQPANPGIYWDNEDPPGNNETGGASAETQFTTFGGATASATSVLFEWTPVSSLADPPFDDDFYTYRIYYKERNDSTWILVDRSTAGFGSGTYDLSLGTTGEALITGLTPLTEYHYYITAVDVFGNEVETGNSGDNDSIYSLADRVTGQSYGSFITTPFGITVSINDGIQTWSDTDFNTGGPDTRPLRDTAVYVRIVIASAVGQPDSVNLILASGDTVTAPDLVLSGSLNGAADYDRIAFQKIGSDEWLATIPNTNRFMGFGNQLRFILEIIKDGVASYTDHDADYDTSEQPPNPADPNDLEWTFEVSTQVAVTPWPTRILNNVIDKKHPIAYPAYYLTHDAKVTIKVYDVKGRPVATLLDKAYRKGGQNIKENGWAGINKARRKLGVGLYYIHIHAVMVGSKKVILNEFKKVVIAR